MTQPPPTPAPDPWAEYPEVDPKGNPVTVSRTDDPWSDYPEAPEQPSLASPNQPVPDHPAEQLASGMVRGGLSAINPINLAKAAWELGKMGVKAAVNPSSVDLPAVGRGLYETGAAALGQRGPEAAGEVYGGLLAGGLPAGRAAGVVVPKLGYTHAARARQIIKALRKKGGPEATEAFSRRIHRLEPELDLPVSASIRSLSEKLKGRVAETGEAVGATEDALVAAASENIPAAAVTRRMPRPPGQRVTETIPESRKVVVGAEGYEDVVTPSRKVKRFVPDRPSADTAYRESVERIKAAAGEAGKLPVKDVVRLKRSAAAEAAEAKAFERTAGQEASIAARESAKRERALRGTLEDLPGEESEAFSKANREAFLARTLERPVTLEAARIEKQAPLSRGVEILAGRAAAAGRGGPIGALAGLAGGQVLDSPLYLTASIATKRRVIDALESGNAQLATDILFKSAVAEHTTRRRAAEALAAQAEGVVAP